MTASPAMTQSILLVDDDDSLRIFLCKTLEKEGFNVVDFANPINAFDHFDKNIKAYDLVLTDIVMPDMDGFEFSQKIKSRNNNIPILFMSGFVGLDHANSNHDFIAKPFHLKDIVARVKETLANQTATP